MKKKVLITQPWPPSYVSEFDAHVSWLEARGLEVLLDPKQNSLSEEDVIQRLPGLFAHICGADRLSAKALEYADQLKIISRIGVGYDTVDIAAATKKGIAVTITPGAGSETVAEFAFALMMTASRNIIANAGLVRQGGWARTNGHSLYRKTLGIAGMGRIGKQLAKIVQGFDMEIIAYDVQQDNAFAAAHRIRYVGKDELVHNSDYLSLHMALNEQTANFIAAPELQAMKRSAILINTSRGGLVDEMALYDALKTGEIASAALDVFVEEPVPIDHPLLTLDNFIGTAHNAGTSREGKNNVVRAAVQNVLDILDGKIPEGTLNASVLLNH